VTDEPSIPPIPLLEQEIGQRVHRIVPVNLETGGAHSAVFDLTTGGGSFVLRIPRGRQGYYTAYLPPAADPADWFDCRWALAIAQHLDFPSPRLVCSHRRPPRFVVLTKLDGVPISDYESWGGCPYDEAELGAILGRLHTVVPSGFGPIDDAGRTYFTSWSAFLTAVADRVLATCRQRGSIGPELHAALRRHWYPALGELRRERPALLHLESLGFANLLYDPPSRRITGLLDFEDCIGGDPLFELTWMEYYFGGRSSGQPYFDYDRFAWGYGLWPEDEYAARLYRGLILLEKLTWIDPSGRRAREHRERLERLCRDVAKQRRSSSAL
jgi:aminoglycoside phosphotransferase (APT) family kinase protein